MVIEISVYFLISKVEALLFFYFLLKMKRIEIMMQIDKEIPVIIITKTKYLMRRAFISLASLLIIDISFVICYTFFASAAIDKPSEKT